MRFITQTVALCVIASTAASLSASEVRVWGDTAVIDTYDSTRAILTVPAALAGKNVIAVKGSYRFAVALTDDKQVYVWGTMPTLNGVPFDLTAIPIGVQGHARQIEILSGSIVALLDSGEVIPWGIDFNGDVNQAPKGTEFDGVGRGFASGVAWTSAGVPRVWGNDVPAVSAGTAVAEAIVIQGGLVYRRLSDNHVMSFGLLDTGFPGLVPPDPAISATKIVLSVDLDALFAIRPDRTVTAWGSNTTGLLTVPSNLIGVTQVAGGIKHALARRVGGGLTTWGDGVVNGLNIPADLAHARLIAAGLGFSVAVISQAPSAVSWLSGGQAVSSAPNGTVIGRVTGSDPDPGDTLTYSLAAGAGDTDNARFSIVNDELRLIAALPAGPTTVSVRVRSTDESGRSTETPLIVNVSAAPAEPSSESKRCGLGGGLGLVLGLTLGFLRLRREARR